MVRRQHALEPRLQLARHCPPLAFRRQLARAGDGVVRDDHLFAGIRQALGAAEAHIADVPEVDQAADALADRRFQGCQIGADLQVLNRLAERVGGGHADTKTVLKARVG